MSHRSSAALPSSKKTHSEKHKQILKQLLKEAPNKSCADCKVTKNPRWASWNLGCFVCIRCSGIHRSMGTHISKVKSVDLDAWTDEQVEQMIKWGNEKTNVYWEAQLPGDYVPNQSKIENFIRTKYELKKWAASTTIPDPMSLKTTPSTVPVASPAPAPAPVQSISSRVSPGANAELLSISNTHSKPKAQPQSSQSLFDDDFGSFTSSPSPKPVAQQLQQPQRSGIQTQSAQSTGGSMSSANNGRPDLKKSILSLYSSPSSSSSFIQPQQQQQQTRNAYGNGNQTSVNNLSNSLNGLNFNSTTSSYPASTYNNTNSSNSSTINSATSFNSTKNSVPAAKPSWNNEWTDSSSSLPKQYSNTNTNNSTLKVSGLDDDLFKNVWN